MERSKPPIHTKYQGGGGRCPFKYFLEGGRSNSLPPLVDGYRSTRDTLRLYELITDSVPSVLLHFSLAPVLDVRSIPYISTPTTDSCRLSSVFIKLSTFIDFREHSGVFDRTTVVMGIPCFVSTCFYTPDDSGRRTYS